MKRHRFGLDIALMGVVLQVVGLAADALLHSRNPHLAVEEHVLTLTNPAHALFALGFVLTTVGVCMLLAARGTLTPWGLRLRTVPLALVGILAAVACFFAFRMAADMAGHEPAQINVEEARKVLHVSTADTHRAPAGTGVVPVQAPQQSSSRHEHGPEVKLSLADLGMLHEQLQTARQATEKYRDIAVARTEGYVQVTQDLPRTAAHFVKYSLVDSVFDPAQPEALLYTRRLSGSWELVGVMYLTPPGPTPPEGFAGPLDSWHYHTNLCFVGISVFGNATAESCAARGGRFRPQTGWMLHAWLYLESPSGLFSAENPLLQGRSGDL